MQRRESSYLVDQSCANIHILFIIIGLKEANWLTHNFCKHFFLGTCLYY